ncbi:MAG TPA: hypothetical protein DDY49_10100 [Paenibacillaceae bacterium]|nr:hypothetical protein [Paenibacillaceae bacterium]
MKKGYKWSLIGLGVLIFIGITYFIAHAYFKNKMEYYEVAQKGQMVGYWELVQWNDEMKKQNKINPWPFNYQWFGIYEDGRFYSYMANEKADIGATQLEKLFNSAQGNITYTYDQGLMKVKYTDFPNIKEVWAVTVVTKKTEKNGVEFLPGDLIMSIANEKGETVYYRHLRKVS